MANLIKDLASYDRARVGRNVSDLLWFYNSEEEAVQVGKDFLFSVSADLSRALVTGEHYDSLEILWHVLTSFDRAAHVGTGAAAAGAADSGNDRNRLVVIGGYGWGKSTLALVAAQLLGLPNEEKGHAAVVSALGPETGDSPRQLVDKVRSRKPKFTICIKGANRSFQDLLVSAVAASKARYHHYLERHGLSLNVKSEYDGAREYLERLSDAPGFDVVLRNEGVSLSGVLSGLASLDPAMLAVAERLYQGFNRVGTDATPVWHSQGDVARYLEELVKEVTKDPDGPFDGVLVLFDELGLWLAYANESENRAGVPALLAVMEAAQRYRHQLTICSFIQADIESFVGRDSESNNVRHVSERLGVRLRYRPDLERVFQSAIKPIQNGRRELWDRHEADFEQLAEQLTRFFSTRYRSGVWERPGKIKDILVKRSWPIHPFMVSVVCQLRFGQGARVVGILEDQFPKLNEQLVEDDSGRLTWSVPIDVVDFYRANFENLHAAEGERKLWDKYVYAKQSLRASDDDPAIKVLKAVFLTHALAGNVRITSSEEFVEFVSVLAGMPELEVSAALSLLSSNQGTPSPVLLANPATGWFEFFSANQNPTEARDYVRRRYDEQKSVSFGEDFAFFNACSLTPRVFAQNRHLQVHGYQALCERVIDVNNLTPGYLVGLAQREVLDEVDPPWRGIHVVVLYDEDKKPTGLPYPERELPERVREHCQTIVNEAWRILAAKGEEVPLFLSVPTDPPSDLYQCFGLIRFALTIPPEDAKRFGPGLETFIQIEGQRLEKMKPVWTAPSKYSLVIPDAAADARLAAIGRMNNRPQAVAALFEAVLPSAPPLNHVSFGSGGTRWARYLQALFGFLCNPNRNPRALAQEHANALESVLLSTNAMPDRNWMVVDETASGFKVAEPRNVYASQCYEAFDSEVRRAPLGTLVSLKDLWTRLCRAPYGLDIRQFVLMFGVWLDLHRDECVLRNSAGHVAEWEFVLAQCGRVADVRALVTTKMVSLQLRDVTAETVRVRAFLERLRAWRPGDAGGDRLVDERRSLSEYAPGAPEWALVDRELVRIKEDADRETGQLHASRELEADAGRNCRLENLTDYARRLNALAVEGPHAPRVKEVVASCLAAMLRCARDGASAAINRKYQSADVERHELDRAIAYINAASLEEVGRTIGQSIGEATLEELNAIRKPLVQALNTLTQRSAMAEAEAKNADLFRLRLGAVLQEVSEQGAGIVRLLTVTRRLDEMVADCPESLRMELERAAVDHGRRTDEKVDGVRAWIESFNLEQSPEAVAGLLSKTEEVIAAVEASEYMQPVLEIASTRERYQRAAEVFVKGRASFNDGPGQAEHALAVLREIEEGMPGGRSTVFEKWRSELVSELSSRRSVANARAKALEDTITKTADPDVTIRLSSSISAFEREHAAYAPDAAEKLMRTFLDSLAKNAPSQIAAILRPLDERSRQEAVQAALAQLSAVQGDDD